MKLKRALKNAAKRNKYGSATSVSIPRGSICPHPDSGKECRLFSAVSEAKVKPAFHTLYSFEAVQTNWGRMLDKSWTKWDKCWMNVGRMLDEIRANKLRTK